MEAEKEQKLMTEQAWKTTLEAERLEKLEHVNKLLERVKMMEIRQGEIKQDMEKKLKNVQEIAQEKFQRSVTQMQEDYQNKLEQEVQRCSLECSQKERVNSTVNKVEEKLNSKQTAIETVKRMLHQDWGKTESPEMDWDYYGDQSQDIGQPQCVKGAQGSEREERVERRQIPNRAASTPLEEEPYSRSYGTFGLSAEERHYSWENCLKKHEPPLCMCPSCRGPHLISKCPYGGIPEGEMVPKARLTEPWKRCETCHLCHQGTCPCARCGGLAHIAVDCVVSTMENWFKIPTAKWPRRDQISPEKKFTHTTVEKLMWCGKCGVSHPQNEPCKYPNVSKSLWCSTCGGRQNDHLMSCPVQRGTSTLPICKRCGEEGHTQENCTAYQTSCYKCGEMGHLAYECTRMGRFGLRHQIYEPPLQEVKPYCYHCREEGHSTEMCAQVKKGTERGSEKDRYREAYKELLQKDPIASMDETITEYPSHDYRQIDNMIEERK